MMGLVSLGWFWASIIDEGTADKIPLEIETGIQGFSKTYRVRG